MIDRGLVEREFDRSDRRRSILTLSAQGQAVYDEVAPLALRLEASLLASLDEDARHQLWQLLDKLDAAELRAHS
jgi:DNA-binding MarR family transcriptional regulator